MMSPPKSTTVASPSSPPSNDPQLKLDNLPIKTLRSKIVEKIQENRVTLIIGETGCGKSSQVPQFLLEENMGPILCTQPRRFAVVAIARMVALARGCQVGGEVGYHIGHSKVLSSSSKIVFKTAGVLLDEMRERGLQALKYKVIILDEVHERSIESDLVLACVKQFLLRQNDMRVVLMSATADIARYREYFNDLGKNERVEVLAIPSSSQHTIYQQQVSYLEQVTKLLEISSESLALKYLSGPYPPFADAGIKSEVHELIKDLVIHIHKNEPDMEKSILVFLPTYHDLEQQWSHLKRFTADFKIHILHSSIDTEQALKAMKIWKSIRKVILATNIAESSVTIPKVAYVIDSCRTLQVYWDNMRRKEVSDLVWVSKSQANQRKGRTGRTCHGHVYRLVTRSFYNQLVDYESPAILRLSLRQQVLTLCCSDSKAISDPKVLLQKTLDPPDPEVVKDALNFLVNIHALEKMSPRGRYEPTYYGRLLASFSLSLDASIVILKFGEVGMMREGILLGVLMDVQPLPIVRPFGEDHLFGEYTASYYSGDRRKTGLAGKKEESLMGNFAAFQFWQHVFKDKHRLERLQEIFLNDEEYVNTLLSKKEENWCLSHHLIQTSLHHVAEIYEDILDTLHRFRPKFLGKCGGLLSYDNPFEFQHTCHLKCEQNEDGDVLDIYEDERPDTIITVQKCTNEPFVAANYFKLENVAANFANIIKEIRWIQYMEKTSTEQLNLDEHDSPPSFGEATPCVYFLRGMCNRGSQCVFSHSLQAKRAACKFFFSLQGCRNGESCYFSHDEGIIPPSQSGPGLCLPEEEVTDFSSLLHVFPAYSDGYILILDDTDFRFSPKFAHYYDPSSIICTTSQSGDLVNDPSMMGIKILSGLSHPYQTLDNKEGESLIPWHQVKCVLWFPFIDSFGGDWEVQKSVLKTFFEYLSGRILADALFEVQIIVTMNNIRFSQLQAEKLGRECFFFLKESVPYDESKFGPLHDTVTVKRPMLVSKPVSYVFYLSPPSNIPFNDSIAVVS